jgi:hypothetical protein
MSSSHWIAIILIGLLVAANIPFVYFSKKKRTDTAHNRQAKDNLHRSLERSTTARPRSAAGPIPWRSDPHVEAPEPEDCFAQATAAPGSTSDE